jgi:hypothetical protein
MAVTEMVRIRKLNFKLQESIKVCFQSNVFLGISVILVLVLACVYVFARPFMDYGYTGTTG